MNSQDIAQKRELVGLLGGATAGIHLMIDAHFSINVLEYMAAGAIPIAGSKMDIVFPEEGKQTGFLVETIKEYYDAIFEDFKDVRI
ncbi:hypothetical protein L6452_34245 [Arctium lappa]|uniref:Uncharacterized protein n=1 Tax=Arctium lappa TaxID=4217 RepID=A0ACB8YJ92_ARCLA|nr:hypothetical protein L6452_34245 [Arctium lappa]